MNFHQVLKKKRKKNLILMKDPSSITFAFTSYKITFRGRYFNFNLKTNFQTLNQLFLKFLLTIGSTFIKLIK